MNPHSYRANARAALSELGERGRYLVPLGVLGPFSQWLGWPDWLRDGTTLTGNGQLPQHISMADDITITANFLERGHGPFLIGKTLQTNRFVTGPTASIIIRNAPSLRDALENLTALIDATNMNVALRFSMRGDRASVTVWPKLPLGAMLDFVAAIRLILVIRTLETFLLRKLDSVSLNLSLSYDDGLENFFARLAERAEFGASTNRITFPSQWLDKQNPDFDASLWQIARQRLKAAEAAIGNRDLASRLGQHVAASLTAEGRVPRLKEIAAAEGVTVRTLGRKLANTGVKFQQIIDRERQMLIENLLADHTISLADVARRTGYSNLSSFGRAFQQWRGQSPRDYRKSLRP